MNALASLRSRWQTKLAPFLIGGAVLHFAPGIYMMALIGTIIFLVISYHKKHKSSGSHLQAGRHLLGHFSSKTAQATPEPAPAAPKTDAAPRRPRRQCRPVTIDTSRYQIAQPEAPESQTNTASNATRATGTPAITDPFTVDPETDDGYRCFEHGINHDCPLDQQD